MINRPTQGGFSLFESLVVIAALSLLLAMSIPAVQRLRETSNKVDCQSQMRQIGIALHHYHASEGRLPPGPFRRDQRDPQFALSWMTQLLPFLEQDAVWLRGAAECAAGGWPYRNPPHHGLEFRFRLYACPSDERLRTPLTDADGVTAAYSSYLGVSGVRAEPNGMFGYPLESGPGLKLTDATDGVSCTLLLGERPPPDSLQAGQWYAGVWHMSGVYGQLRGPDHMMRVRQYAYGDDRCGSIGDGFRFGPGVPSNPCDRYHFWSLHSGGANFLFADASCRFLRHSADEILADLATRNGAEAVEVPD